VYVYNSVVCVCACVRCGTYRGGGGDQKNINKKNKKKNICPKATPCDFKQKTKNHIWGVLPEEACEKTKRLANNYTSFNLDMTRIEKGKNATLNGGGSLTHSRISARALCRAKTRSSTVE